MTKLIDWVKSNKLASVLAVVLLFLILRQLTSRSPVMPLTLPTSYMNSGARSESFEIASPAMMAQDSAKVGIGMMPPFQPDAPPTLTTTRMVTKDTTLSLKVDDVEKSVSGIEAVATNAGGYLIDSNVSVPEGAASATISIRIPSEKRTEVLASLKSSAVKVVTEYVNGQDVTDQYVDSEERLRILESTKVKFEGILDRAVNVNEMLNVQRELLNLQQQIDAIKGQQKYLEGTTKLSRVTVYLSTDELALPYAPDNSWRPSVVAKEAVRSLILNLREIGTLLIWMVVYAPVWIIGILVIWAVRRKMKQI